MSLLKSIRSEDVPSTLRSLENLETLAGAGLKSPPTFFPEKERNVLLKEF